MIFAFLATKIQYNSNIQKFLPFFPIFFVVSLHRMRNKIEDIAKRDLFTPSKELQTRYDAATVKRLERLRGIYTLIQSDPTQSDREIVAAITKQYDISHTRVYADLQLLKTILPAVFSASRDWHRYKTNEMLLETYKAAKEVGDLRTMAATAATYSKVNRVEKEDEQMLPFDEIVVQPFTPTNDPAVLGTGFKKLENRDERVKYLLKKYGAQNPDIIDIEAEPADN